MARSIQLPAPGRGAYDRSLSRTERDAQHRERLLLAAAEVLELGTPTVARIVERAGVGRSTFYEFFDSPEHLVEQLEQRVCRAIEAAMESALHEAHTPLERVRAIARRFIREVEARPIETRVALARRVGSSAVSPAGGAVQRALQRVTEDARLDALGWFRATDEVSLLAAAAAMEAIGRRQGAGPPLPDAAKLMSDLVIKLLR
jgi:AcrR family transcriptional regulator